MSDRKTVGIDLGTTYSVVAFLDSSLAPHTAMNLEGDLTTPSAVFFEDDVAIVGKEAIKAATHEPEAVALHVKRDMGKACFHQAIRGQKLPPEVIQAAILRKLISDATLKVGEVHEAVITVPAFFNEPRRKATMDAGRLAGLKVLDIINEPTAAAIAYGVHAGFLSADGTAPSRETVLVYDLGGGTFDVTLMEIQQLQFTALATDGDVHLGGIDWDRRIVDHIADAFQKQHNLDPRQDPEAARELAAEAEDAKRALTSRASITVRFSYSGKRSQVTLTREQFETMTCDLLQRTIFTVERLLKSAKKSWPDLTRILLVGGSTRMPMIQAALRSVSGMEVDRSLSPDEAVAHGAAIYAGFVKRGKKATDRNLAVKNVNSHDLGVLAREKATGMQRRRIMIPRNSLLPARSKSKFVTQRTGQKRVVINVIEGGDDSGKNATSIGKCVVSGLPKDLPAGAPVIVQFVYKTSGRLSVSAELPTIGSKAEMTIERSSGMNEQTLRHWEQRIAAGRYLDFGNAEDPNGQSSNAALTDRKNSRVETGLVQVPLAEFESPQVYTDDEDSEVFSDLDF